MSWLRSDEHASSHAAIYVWLDDLEKAKVSNSSTQHRPRTGSQWSAVSTKIPATHSPNVAEVKKTEYDPRAKPTKHYNGTDTKQMLVPNAARSESRHLKGGQRPLELHGCLLDEDRSQRARTGPARSQQAGGILKARLLEKGEHVAAAETGGIVPRVNEVADSAPSGQTRYPPPPVCGQSHYQKIEAPGPAICQNTGSHQRPEECQQKREQRYERQPRHKTRPDRYELKRVTKGQESIERPIDRREPGSRKRKERSGAVLMDNFVAPNVTNERLTLKKKRMPGLFAKGRASSLIRLASLAFSESDFLNLNPPYHGHSNNNVCKQDSKIVKTKRRAVIDKEAEISQYFSIHKARKTAGRVTARGERSPSPRPPITEDPQRCPRVPLSGPSLGVDISCVSSEIPAKSQEALQHKHGESAQGDNGESHQEPTEAFIWSESDLEIHRKKPIEAHNTKCCLQHGSRSMAIPSTSQDGVQLRWPCRKSQPDGSHSPRQMSANIMRSLNFPQPMQESTSAVICRQDQRAKTISHDLNLPPVDKRRSRVYEHAKLHHMPLPSPSIIYSDSIAGPEDEDEMILHQVPAAAGDVAPCLQDCRESLSDSHCHDTSLSQPCANKNGHSSRQGVIRRSGLDMVSSTMDNTWQNKPDRLQPPIYNFPGHYAFDQVMRVQSGAVNTVRQPDPTQSFQDGLASTRYLLDCDLRHERQYQPFESLSPWTSFSTSQNRTRNSRLRSHSHYKVHHSANQMRNSQSEVSLNVPNPSPQPESPSSEIGLATPNDIFTPDDIIAGGCWPSTGASRHQSLASAGKQENQIDYEEAQALDFLSDFHEEKLQDYEIPSFQTAYHQLLTPEPRPPFYSDAIHRSRMVNSSLANGPLLPRCFGLNMMHNQKISSPVAHIPSEAALEPGHSFTAAPATDSLNDESFGRNCTVFEGFWQPNKLY